MWGRLGETPVRPHSAGARSVPDTGAADGRRGPAPADRRPRTGARGPAPADRRPRTGARGPARRTGTGFDGGARRPASAQPALASRSGTGGRRRTRRDARHAPGSWAWAGSAGAAHTLPLPTRHRRCLVAPTWPAAAPTGVPVVMSGASGRYLSSGCPNRRGVPATTAARCGKRRRAAQTARSRSLAARWRIPSAHPPDSCRGYRRRAPAWNPPPDLAGVNAGRRLRGRRRRRPARRSRHRRRPPAGTAACRWHRRAPPVQRRRRAGAVPAPGLQRRHGTGDGGWFTGLRTMRRRRPTTGGARYGDRQAPPPQGARCRRRVRCRCRWPVPATASARCSPGHGPAQLPTGVYRGRAAGTRLRHAGAARLRSRPGVSARRPTGDRMFCSGSWLPASSRVSRAAWPPVPPTWRLGQRG
jgi:hypothetical protein